ncbi:MAG: universal stress protein [Gammaproteobacteria bacterium]|nr:universal stress protein [Gammaproteobacteria bacterium]
MLAINRILCPVDFSEPSTRALEYALALAERLGAHVDVVHVFQFPTFAVDDLTLPLYLQENLSQRLRERLEQFVIEKAGEGSKATAHVREGVPYLEIMEAAKGQDLIVMGTHGRSGLSHLLLGSVAERVVRGSEVPVLTIRSAGSP